MGQVDGHDDEPFDESHDEEPDRPSGSPPDPLDRLWRHPTELPPVVAAPSSRRASPTWLVAVAAGAAGAILTVVVLAAIGSFDDSSSNSNLPLASGQGQRRVPATDIAKDVGESVVAIVAHDSHGIRRGSGVCVRHEGDILTSSHLIGDATRIAVTTSDGTTHSAKVTGRDPTTDLALLSIDGGVAAAQLAEDQLAAGNAIWIVAAPAVGSTTPWMSGGTVATTDALVASPSGPTTAGLVETNAAANAAASGGALVDPGGSVVGIVLSPIGDARTTYAVPISTAVAVAQGLRRNGLASHGSLGVEGVDSPNGPTVTGVPNGSAAARAGVRANDVITGVDGQPVNSMAEVMAIVRRWAPGKTVLVELLRGDKAWKVQVELGDLNPRSATTTTAPKRG